MTVTDDSTDDHGHHLPAVEDWPKGFGEASWWPFVTAIGAAGFYIGAALYVLGQNDTFGFVTPMVGPAVFVGSVFVFLAGLYGWVYHAFVKHFWSRETTGGKGLRWGMILFLGTEIATFGAVFAYYFFIRAGAQWSQAVQHVPEEHFPVYIRRISRRIGDKSHLNSVPIKINSSTEQQLLEVVVERVRRRRRNDVLIRVHVRCRPVVRQPHVRPRVNTR